MSQASVILFLNNPWTITIIGGVIVLAIGFYFFTTKQNNDTSLFHGVNDGQKQTVTQTVIIGDVASTDKKNDKIVAPNKIDDLAYLKAKVKILFIEDDKFKKIDNLKKFGWNVSQVKKVDNLDTEEIRQANIIFVDYKGVGELSGDQGVGIVQGLKEMYKDDKWIIFYSAHRLPLGVHDKGADSFLDKNANVYQMETKIIQGAKKVIK